MAANDHGAKRQGGRGRLSSLDRLPPAAADALAWANAELAEYNLTQVEILRMLNARLTDLGIAPISGSAFSRHSIRLAIGARTAKAMRLAEIDLFDHLRIGAPSDGRPLEVDALRFVLVQLLTREDVDSRKVEAASHLLISLMVEDGHDG